MTSRSGPCVARPSPRFTVQARRTGISAQSSLACRPFGRTASEPSNHRRQSAERPVAPAHPADDFSDWHRGERPRIGARTRVVAKEPHLVVQIDVADALHQQAIAISRVPSEDDVAGAGTVVSGRTTIRDHPVARRERRQHALAFDAAAQKSPAKPENETDDLDSHRNDGRRPEQGGSPVTPQSLSHAGIRQLAR